MSKGKHGKKKRGGNGSAIGAGLLGGAASLIANKAVGEVVKEVVEYGTRKAIGLRKGQFESQDDVGVHVLQLLADRDEPVSLAAVAPEAKAGLLKVLDALRSLRRARLIKYSDGRRSISLTALGRETLEALTTAERADAESSDAQTAGDGNEAGNENGERAGGATQTAVKRLVEPG